MLWYNAKIQSAVAGYNSIGVERTFCGGMIISGVNVLGANALSVGLTTESLKSTNAKVIEGDSNGLYHRLLVADGVLVGAQLIGNIFAVGPLISLIRRRANLEKSREDPMMEAYSHRIPYTLDCVRLENFSLNETGPFSDRSISWMFAVMQEGFTSI